MPWPFVLLLSVCFILSALSPQIFGDDSDDANRKSWPLSVLEGLQFVHCQDDYSRKVFKRDEQTQLNWLATQTHCFGGGFLRQLQKKIDEWNEKLSNVKRKVLELTNGQVKCMKDREYWQSRLLNAIWMIFRAQNITIGQYFLEEFLNNIEHNKVGMGKVIQIVKKQEKVFDMTRYEKKREANEADLESIKVQLEEKFNNFKDKVNHPKKPEKEYAIDFSMEEHLDILNKIKAELAKVQLKWPSTEEKENEANKVQLERTSTGESKANKVQLEWTPTESEANKVQLDWTPTESEADQFWTIDQRPVVRQTLWIIRHAEREDNVNKKWGKDLSELEKEDSPLSERGIRQAEELGRWFGKINVDRVYASPFIRCLETANELIGGKNYPRGSIQQGTDQRGSDQKESDKTVKGKNQKGKRSDQKESDQKESDQKGSDQIEWIDQRGIFINCEPGLAEFYDRSNIKFGFKPCQSQKTFSIDSNYLPLFNGDLLQMMEMERQERSVGKERSADDHDFVTVQTIRHILENNREAENIVFVTHMQNIGLMLELMGAEWAAVGQATISKLVKYEENVGIGKTSDVLQQFRLEYASGVTHLTERKDLRPR